MTRTAVALALVLSLASPSRVGAMPGGSAAAAEALQMCRLAEQRTGEGRLELLASGLELAESALRSDANDAGAHFAVFCNLGRRLQTIGMSVVHPFEILRALRELDRAVALAPEDPDVATAKGALLVSLPRLLGGDPVEGEAWLRRALELDPHHCVARWYLADVLARRGAATEAELLRTTC